MNTTAEAKVFTITSADLIGRDENDPTLPAFPMDTLHPMIQELVEQVNAADGLNLDALASSAIFAVSVGLGGAYRAQLTTTQEQGASVYMCLVMPSSTGKSPAQKILYAPLMRYNGEQRMKYRDALRLHQQAGSDDSGGHPTEGLALFHDITIEAIKERMEQRPQGIGLIKDELDDLMKNMGRYSGGDDTPFYLEAYNGGPMSATRKGKASIWVDNACLSIAAGIQPAILKGLPKRRNGFLARWLWVHVQGAKMPRRSDGSKSADPGLLMAYDTAIRHLLQLGDDLCQAGPFEPVKIDFTPDARELIDQLHHELMDRADKVIGTPEAELIGKLDAYSVRLALIMEFMWWACESSARGHRKDPPTAIGVDSVRRSMQLVEYFRRHGMRVLDTIYSDDPTASMTEQQRTVYDAIPDQDFQRRDALLIANDIGMKDRAFDAFLKDRSAFSRVKNGVYRKRA